MLHLELPFFHHPSSKWEQSPPKPGNAQHDFAENEKKKITIWKYRHGKLSLICMYKFGIEEREFFSF